MVILFAKHIPTRVTEKSNTVKKVTSKIQQKAKNLFSYYPYIIMANLFIKLIPKHFSKTSVL